MEFSFTFIKILFSGLYLVAPILIMLFTLIIILGLIVGRLESWEKFNSLYWALITALTVGYGDIRPKHKASRLLSIIIATFGIMLAGILVAITVEAMSRSFKEHVTLETMKKISGNLEYQCIIKT